MKLRLRGNSLRLRLTRTEVARLAAGGRIDETVSFSKTSILVYAIERRDEIERVTASFDGKLVTVRVPSAIARRFAESDDVGFNASQGVLKILVEKDWRCLTLRDEDENDAYPHPHAKGT